LLQRQGQSMTVNMPIELLQPIAAKSGSG